MTMRVAVAGASGYAGGELLRLLVAHPKVQIGAVTAKNQVGQRLGAVHPQLTPLSDRILTETTAENLADHDIVFLALPHGASAALAQQLDPEVLVIDLGADFRLQNSADWHNYYPGPHAGTWTYGLPELPGQRVKLANSRRIAIPGCHPTASILGLLPGLVSGAISGSDIVITSLTGNSGAGKSAKIDFSAAELMGNTRPYSVAGTHRHIPEITQTIMGLGGSAAEVTFTPILVPMPRGILATISTPLLDETVDLQQLWNDYYRDEPFVEVLAPGQLPQTKTVLSANTAKVAITQDANTRRLLINIVIDNLTKGTAGAAIQTMNIAQGWPEETALSTIGVSP